MTHSQEQLSTDTVEGHVGLLWFEPNGGLRQEDSALVLCDYHKWNTIDPISNWLNSLALQELSALDGL
jgi:hypothetical protein